MVAHQNTERLPAMYFSTREQKTQSEQTIASTKSRDPNLHRTLQDRILWRESCGQKEVGLCQVRNRSELFAIRDEYSKSF